MRYAALCLAGALPLLLSVPASAAPKANAQTQAVHQQFAAKDATIADFRRQIDSLNVQLAALRAQLGAGGAEARSGSALPGFPPGSEVSHMPPAPAPYIAPPDSPMRRAWRPKGPAVTARNYKLILPPGGIPASLMRFEKIVDRHVKLHPEAIASVVVAHGWVNWVRVVDAEQSPSVAYPYMVNAEFQVSYPADPAHGQIVPYTSLERPSFQINPKTGEIGGEGTF